MLHLKVDVLGEDWYVQVGYDAEAMFPKLHASSRRSKYGGGGFFNPQLA